MVTNKLGHIRDNLYYLGLPECPIFLLDGPQPVVFDAGISWAGKIYAEAIRTVLKGRQPSILFLTHVHWDHCGAAAYLKNAFPDMKIAASSLGADILKRPNALALIGKLNAGAKTDLDVFKTLDPELLTEVPFAPFDIDIDIDRNNVIKLSKQTLEILATPGHTQDHHSFYLPAEKILIAGEAGGVYYAPGVVSSEFVSNYDTYLASLRRLSALPTEIFCQGHNFILTGREEISAFFERSINETISFKDRAMELLEEEDGSVERVMSRIKAERYDTITVPKQPEVPYLLNLKAQISHLAAKRPA
ncbi:MAG: MBL fold metallo-hydrolase [Syntrophomonadaceae bacterium]|nr:MBL fold metallo-hydrolase [Syntrophomonadaceae bacterium]